jgi:hypothetical protein
MSADKMIEDKMTKCTVTTDNIAVDIITADK